MQDYTVERLKEIARTYTSHKPESCCYLSNWREMIEERIDFDRAMDYIKRRYRRTLTALNYGDMADYLNGKELK